MKRTFRGLGLAAILVLGFAVAVFALFVAFDARPSEWWERALALLSALFTAGPLTLGAWQLGREPDEAAP